MPGNRIVRSVINQHCDCQIFVSDKWHSLTYISSMRRYLTASHLPHAATRPEGNGLEVKLLTFGYQSQELFFSPAHKVLRYHTNQSLPLSKRHLLFFSLTCWLSFMGFSLRVLFAWLCRISFEIPLKCFHRWRLLKCALLGLRRKIWDNSPVNWVRQRWENDVDVNVPDIFYLKAQLEYSDLSYFEFFILEFHPTVGQKGQFVSSWINEIFEFLLELTFWKVDTSLILWLWLDAM